MTPADNEIVNTLSFDLAPVIEGSIIEIECPGCPVMITNLEGQSKYNTAPVISKLRFDFSISHDGERDNLLLNGHQLYPVIEIFDSVSQRPKVPLSADQLIQTPSGKWAHAATPSLGHALAFRTTAVSSEDQTEFTFVNLQVIQIDDHCIASFPNIYIKLLSTPSGKLMIGDIDVSPDFKDQSAFCPVVHVEQDVNVAVGHARPTAECTSLLCEWRAAIAENLEKAKQRVQGCGRKRPEGSHMTRPNNHGHGRPRPHGPHRAHRHHHRHGGFARFLRSIVFHVFIPIMIGVVVGITASLVGMVVGHIAIFIWRLLFRRGERATYSRVVQEIKEDYEGKSSPELENPPPVYEDAPAYEEEEVVVIEKV
jgi:hypothetical protein